MADLVLRTTLLLATTWVVARLLGRATAATRHLVWHFGVVAVLAAPIVSPILPQVIALPTPALQSATVLASLDVRSQRHETSEAAGSPQPAAAALPTMSLPARFQFVGTETLAATWLLGSLFLCAWYLVSYAMAARLVRRSTPAAGIQIEADRARVLVGSARSAEIRFMDREASPLTIGLFRSFILLPANAASWNADRRQAVLLHELAHVRRGDCRAQALAHAACTLYWFNPLVWVAAAALRRERERACDDEVLRSGAQPSTYATYLLELAKALGSTAAPRAALAMARPRELEGRLLAVLAEKRPRVPARSTRWMLATAFSAMALVALGARTHTPPASTSVTVPAAPGIWSPVIESARVEEREQQASASRAAQSAVSRLESADSADARESAIMELAASAQEGAIGALVNALDDPDAQVREKAALALGLHSSPSVVEPLLVALVDPDSQVREKAAIGLGLRRDPRIVEPLIRALSDHDSQVREKAALALGLSGDRRAMPALQHAVNDPDAQVREKAVTALGLLSTAAEDGNAHGEALRSGLVGLVRLIGRVGNYADSPR